MSLQHAFECVTPCRRCKGTGVVGEGKRRRECRSCEGYGNCGHEWRQKSPQLAHPCRLKHCCKCGSGAYGGGACKEIPCRECLLYPKGSDQVLENTYPCAGGGCLSCGGNYVIWHTFEDRPENVVLNYEFTRRRWGGKIRIRIKEEE